MRLWLLCGLIGLALSSCGGSGNDDAGELADRLDTAETSLDDATTLSIALKADDLPSDATGLVSAKGKGNHDPAFTGDVKVSTGGATMGAEIIAVNSDVWAKTSFSSEFVNMDPASLKAPDPADLLSTDNGLSSILTQTHKLQDNGEKRSGSDVVTSIKGELDGEIVERLIPTADTSKTFKVEYSLTDDDELTNARLTGHFYPDTAAMSYTVRVSASSEPVKISEP